jgi:hypothetical protein
MKIFDIKSINETFDKCIDLSFELGRMRAQQDAYYASPEFLKLVDDIHYQAYMRLKASR